MEIKVEELIKYPLTYALSSLHSDDAKDVAHECNVLLVEHQAKKLEVLEAKLKNFFKEDSKAYQNDLYCYIADNDIVDIVANYKEVKVDGHVVRYDFKFNVNSMRKGGVVKYEIKSYNQYVGLYNTYTSNGNTDFVSYRINNDTNVVYHEEYVALSKLVSSFVTYGNSNVPIENERDLFFVLYQANQSFEALDVLRQYELEEMYGIPRNCIVYAIARNYYWYWQFHIKHRTPRQYMYKNFKSFVRNFWTEKDYRRILLDGEHFAIEDESPIVQVMSPQNVDKYLHAKGNAGDINNVEPTSEDLDYDDNDSHGYMSEPDDTYLELLMHWKKQLDKLFK